MNQSNNNIHLQKNRILSIDLLRGIVMVLMALDHVRDYFYVPFINPSNLEVTTPMLFFTRWVTHFCAPVFVFLVGTSVYLSGKKRSNMQLSWLLFTRGIWLIFLEVTIILWGWSFNFHYNFITLQVIWAIGISMIMMSFLIYFPKLLLLLFSIILLFGHHLLDGISSQQLGAFHWVWLLVHEQGFCPLYQDKMIFIVYPLIPWVGVMTAGYCLGKLYDLPAEQRQRYLWNLGLILTGLFMMLRWMNGYGDPVIWTDQETWLYTLMSFFNTTKYPPSLLFLMMTLGPALILLSLTEIRLHPFIKPLVTFGRVPLLYYILHIYLIHALAVLLAYIQTGNGWWMCQFFFTAIPGREDYGLGLMGTYIVWVIVVAALYPVCSWYAHLKTNSQSRWLNYL